jgi:hypothetical protein
MQKKYKIILIVILSLALIDRLIIMITRQEYARTIKLRKSNL